MKISTALVVLAVIASGSAQAQRFGSWEVGVHNNGESYSAATEQHNRMFGQYCFPARNECTWILGVDTACQQGASALVLVNTNVGAQHHSVKCGLAVNANLYAYVFEDYNGISNLVQSAGVIGIALPIDRDQFRTFQFNLNGSSAAITQMKNNAASAMSGHGQTGGGSVGSSHGDAVLFEHSNFAGRSLVLAGDNPDLKAQHFNDTASSIRIVQGVWEACEHAYYQGRCEVFNNDQSGLGWMNDEVSSIRRIR